MKRTAFTLIELLVVIAIIAILAAILFPVFAQAKTAAKKTQSLSNVKQMGTSVHIYLADHDDRMPRSFGWYNGIGNMWNYWHDVPANWRTNDPAYVEFANGSPLNHTEPYRKNTQLLELAGISGSFNPFAASSYTAGNRAIKNGLAYNGLLHAYSHSSIAAVSELPLFTQVGGNLNANGADTGPLPQLWCTSATTPCSYIPNNGTTCGTGNGRWSLYFYPNAKQQLYGNTQTWVFSDSSAKVRRVAMRLQGATDFRQDPYTNYTANGVDNGLAWYDEGYCHALLFRPDFDFATWPSAPVAAF
jgi:prepilin-type N-terminal cleavage/methylation domain-containing protein